MRETQEELYINPDQIDVLGSIGPPEVNGRGDMTVWPFVVGSNYNPECGASNLSIQGFVHPPNGNHPVKPEDPFPSLDINTIREKLPTAEVGAAFHLPLSTLLEPTRRRLDKFREGRPYWAISVADLLQDVQPSIVDVNEQKYADHIPNAVDSNKLEEGLEVWGLTGWYLSLVMKILKI